MWVETCTSAGWLHRTVERSPVATLAMGRLVYGDRISRLSGLGAALALTGVSWGAWHISREVLPEDA